MGFALCDFTRVMINLPTREPGEKTAASAVINKIMAQFGGSTNSSIHNGIFTGRWEDTAGNVITDAISLFFVDAPLSFDADCSYVEKTAEAIRLYADRLYRQHGYPQDKFWITVQKISVWDDVSSSGDRPTNVFQH